MKKENNFRWIEYLLLCKLFPDKFCHNKNISIDFNSIDFQIAMDLIDDIPQTVVEVCLPYNNYLSKTIYYILFTSIFFTGAVIILFRCKYESCFSSNC